jgi:hypothetical protein
VNPTPSVTLNAFQGPPRIKSVCARCMVDAETRSA